MEMMKKLFLSFVICIFVHMSLTAQTTGESTNGDGNNNTLLFSYICDDDKLQNIEDKLKLLVEENDNLRLKLDTFTSSITKFETAISKLTAATTTTTTRQNESTNSITPSCSCNHIMDKPKNITDSNSSQNSSVMKSILPLPTSCTEVFERNDSHKSGIYRIHLPEPSKLEPFFVYCLADTEQPEAPWTIIQRRKDGSIDFGRNWAEYQKGFGNLDGEFFIGLDILHALTQSTPHELWIAITDYRNLSFNANYSSFDIGNASEAYVLKKVGSFKGDIIDRFTEHAGSKFSTQDMDNDGIAIPCAEWDRGGWWYHKGCWGGNLNGRYGVHNYREMTWHTRLTYAHMALRPWNKKCLRYA